MNQIRAVERRKIKGKAYDWMKSHGLEPWVTDSPSLNMMTPSKKSMNMFENVKHYQGTYFIPLNKKNLKKMNIRI